MVTTNPPTKETILVVDDEEDILELLRYNLIKEGYQVVCADTGEEALKKSEEPLPDLIILDLMLPGINGLDVCKQLKRGAKTENVPIIMLTAKTEESDIVTGLEVGGDDYVTKPFSPKVLLARVRSLLRRNDKQLNDGDKIRIHDMVIDPVRHEVLIDGEPIDLTFTEFRTLQTLTQRPGQVFTRYQIVDAIRGSEYAVTDRAVDVQIVSLRKKLKHCGKYIETVRGVGYRFKD